MAVENGIQEAFLRLAPEEFLDECIDTYFGSDDPKVKSACLAYLYMHAPDCDVPRLEEEAPDDDPAIARLLTHCKNLALTATLLEEVANFQTEHPALDKVELIKFLLSGNEPGEAVAQLSEMQDHYQSELCAVFQEAVGLYKAVDFDSLTEDSESPHRQLLATGILERLGFEVEEEV